MSYYKLTIPEIRVLYGADMKQRQMEEDERKGISPGDREGLKEFNEGLK